MYTNLSANITKSGLWIVYIAKSEAIGNQDIGRLQQRYINSLDKAITIKILR